MVRAVKVFMTARVVHGPGGPPSSCGPYGSFDQASQGGPGGQVVRW